MDNIKEDIDLLATLKNLMASNRSQEERIGEYAKLIDSRDSEIDLLQTMLSAANEYSSSVDSQLRELKELHRYIQELQQQVTGSVYLATGQTRLASTVSAERQLQDFGMEFSYLQSKLTGLQMQLQDMNNRNLLLQQQTSRIAGLESLLANTEKAGDPGTQKNGDT